MHVVTHPPMIRMMNTRIIISGPIDVWTSRRGAIDVFDTNYVAVSLPGAFAGILWMLFIAQTTFSVPSMMGTIMAIGVATANSILVVTFCNQRMDAGVSASQAAIEAGFTRLRPVLMTAGAMILGMIPMALGVGEGGEQNAPLARAVIGGLLFATFATLLFVPAMYSLLRRGREEAPRRGSEAVVPA